jgi:uncharacterized protein YgiM (DUF1202 family)
MRNLQYTIVLFLFSFIAFSQSYLGTIKKQVNFREGPGTDSGIISSLKPKTQVFIIDLEGENDFYSIIDITTNKEGYVNKAYVNVEKEIAKSTESVFSPQGFSADDNSHVDVFNNTTKTLTLKLNSEMFYFKPREKKVLTLYAGNYNFRASAPGVMPYIGDENLKVSQDYSWEFYIVTR